MAVAKNTLRVITLERVGEFFNQQSLRLRYTPRKFVIHPGALPVGKFGVAGMRACSSRLCMCLISAVNCWVCSFLQILAEVLTSGISPVTCCPLHPCRLSPADHKMLIVAEADHAAIPLAQREDLKQLREQQQQQQQEQAASMETDQQNGAAPAAASAELAGPEADEESAAREDQFGAPKGEPGQWASCVR